MSVRHVTKLILNRGRINNERDTSPSCGTFKKSRRLSGLYSKISFHWLAEPLNRKEERLGRNIPDHEEEYSEEI